MEAEFFTAEFDAGDNMNFHCLVRDKKGISFHCASLVFLAASQEEYRIHLW